MSVTLVMLPMRSPLNWEEFCQWSPPYSIAVDGFVAAGPRFDETGPRLNLNHHEEVDRLATRATCGQVLIAIRQGLFDCFQSSSGPHAIVHANDCDEDVCLSNFLLKNAFLVEAALNPLINRLVHMVDMLDTTAGAYPYPPAMPAIQELEWIFQPYRNFRHSGALDRRVIFEFVSIVEDVGNRIMRHITGRGESVPLDTRYERVGGGKHWAIIKEIGLQGRTGAFADGIRAYVVSRERSDSRWAHTVGRMSPFISFPVPRILTALNKAEGITTNDRWGGGNTIGGSPRAGGSKLTPPEVEQIITEILAEEEKAHT